MGLFSSAPAASGLIAAQEGVISVTEAIVIDGSVTCLSTGAILGICVGVAVVAVGAAYLIYRLTHRNNYAQPQLPPTAIIRRVNSQQTSSLNTVQLIQTYEELKCPFTHRLMVQPTSLRCQHEFSKHQLTVWLQRNPRCPTCNTQASLSDMRRCRGTEMAIERFKLKAAIRGRQWVQARINADFGQEFIN